MFLKLRFTTSKNWQFKAYFLKIYNSKKIMKKNLISQLFNNLFLYLINNKIFFYKNKIFLYS